MIIRTLSSRLALSMLVCAATGCSLSGMSGGFSGGFFGGRKATDFAELPAAPEAELTFNGAQVNSAQAQQAPYVILVSIDGYRHDYNKVFKPTELNKIASEGVAAQSLRPVYPSKTFPNHYALVTGLRAEHHGIVSNEFYDPARDAIYSLPDRNAVEDGSWYFGEPLWITAGRQGMLSASYYWVGSEAAIQGMHPNIYYRYNESVEYATRVDRVLAWLKYPAEKRPHFITLYFENVDQAAHRFGVNSEATRAAVAHVDRMLTRLREGINASGLPVNLVVVSDHGMLDIEAKKTIVLDEKPEAARILAKFQAVGRGPQMLLYLNKGEDPSVILEAQKILLKGAKNLRVHRREQLTRLGYAATPRVGDLVVEPDAPYLVGLRARAPQKSGANHGWDPERSKAMHGIFMAVGPSFRERTTVETFDNVDVYPLLLEVLGLKQTLPIDGHAEGLRGLLRVSPAVAERGSK